MTIPINLQFPDIMTQVIRMGTAQSGPTLAAQAVSEIWPVAVMLGFLLLFLFAATCVPSYFFEPTSVSPQRQNNAVAMSYYACGPLALFLPLVMTLWGLVKLLQYDRWLAYQWGIDAWFGPVAV
ncbi:MAG: hypothetical protein IID51_10960 [Proteobacteria bacterium]|nr:hypothetical protein [Pseudomonadota bacterium]